MSVRIAATLLIIILVLSGLFGLNSLYTVDPDQSAVVFRGKTAVRVSGPGLHFKFPLFESVEFLSRIQQRTGLVFGQSCQNSSAGSGNGDLEVNIVWDISDPIAYFEAGRPSDAHIEAVARPIACDIGIPADLENKSLVGGFEDALLGKLREEIPGIRFVGVVSGGQGRR